MKVLVLDSSGPSLFVGWYTPTECIEKVHDKPFAHAERISSLVQETLDEGGVTLKEVQGIVLGAGPGSFTGLRITYSFAQGVALALRVPVYTFSGLVAALYCFSEPIVYSILSQGKEGYRWAEKTVNGHEMHQGSSLELEHKILHHTQERVVITGVPGDLPELFSSLPFACTTPLVRREAPQGYLKSLAERALLEKETSEREGFSPYSLAALSPMYGRAVQAKSLKERGVLTPER